MTYGGTIQSLKTPDSHGALANIVTIAKRQKLQSPSIVVIGDVVNIADQLANSASSPLGEGRGEGPLFRAA